MDLKFNNSAVKDEYVKIFWKLSINSFRIFLHKILSLPKKDLKLSIEVLKARENSPFSKYENKNYNFNFDKNVYFNQCPGKYNLDIHKNFPVEKINEGFILITVRCRPLSKKEIIFL